MSEVKRYYWNLNRRWYEDRDGHECMCPAVVSDEVLADCRRACELLYKLQYKENWDDDTETDDLIDKYAFTGDST